MEPERSSRSVPGGRKTPRRVRARLGLARLGAALGRTRPARGNLLQGRDPARGRPHRHCRTRVPIRPIANPDGAAILRESSGVAVKPAGLPPVHPLAPDERAPRERAGRAHPAVVGVGEGALRGAPPDTGTSGVLVCAALTAHGARRRRSRRSTSPLRHRGVRRVLGSASSSSAREPRQPRARGRHGGARRLAHPRADGRGDEPVDRFMRTGVRARSARRWPSSAIRSWATARPARSSSAALAARRVAGLGRFAAESGLRLSSGPGDGRG
jgi:hypothetical protein